MFTFLFVALVLLILFIVLNQKKDPRLPPGLHGWPIIGYPPSFKESLVDQVEKFRQKFGDVFIWRIGARNNVYLCDPKIIRKAFNNPNLIDRPENLLSFDSWSNFTKMGIVNGNGIGWQTHRRFALRHLKDSGFGKAIVEDITLLEAENLVNYFEKNFLDGPSDITRSISVAALNVIWQITADIRFDHDDKGVDSFLSAMLQTLALEQGRITVFDIFPWLFTISPTFIRNKLNFGALMETRHQIKDYIKSVVDKKKLSFDRENPSGLIDYFLLEGEKEEGSGTQDKLFTERDLIQVLADLFFAGTETTSVTLRWGIQLLASHPQIQERIQREIDSVVPRDTLPSLTHKSRLPLTEATVYEVLRRTTLTPLGVFHAASQDSTIEQFFIPKNSVIVPFVHGCHTNPKYWEKPEEFYPEHFLDNDGNFSANNEAFMPFSTGRRACIGENLAKTELFLFMAALLQKFTFKMAERKVESSEKHPNSLIMNMPLQMDLIIQKRL